MSKKWDVAVAGEIFADHVFSGFERWPEPGEEHFTNDYVREVGGGAAITSCALALLGRRVALFGVAGEEDHWLAQRLRSFGVHLDGLRTTQGGTAVSVSISTRKDRSFLTWPGANRALPVYLRQPATQTRLTEARHVHLAMPIERRLALELFPVLRAAGCTLSLDTGHQPQWLGDEENQQTCREVDFFLPNEVEGRIVTGAEEPEQMIAAFRAMGIRGVVLKLGREGAVACGENAMDRAAAPPVEAVDSTGAGDAFDAGLIDALLDGLPMPAMLQRACVCGSLSTRSMGALAALPDREELKSYDVANR
jgi:sugar/nucleoside kinase (ribokinase family)